MSIGHSYVHSSNGRIEMSIGHKYMSLRLLDEQKCPLDIQMSIRPLDEWTLSNANTLVSYPHGVRLSQITSLQLPCIVNVTCPLDINKCPFVHWTNRNVHWTFKCPFVHWTNRNVHWTFKYPFVHWTNRNVHWTFKCPFVYWTNRNVHWTSKCPFVHWTNGHSLKASTLVSNPHGERLSQITSLQLPWHCKRYMSIKHK